MMQARLYPLNQSPKMALLRIKAALSIALAIATCSCSPLTEPTAPANKDIARVEQQLTPEVARALLLELVTDPAFTKGAGRASLGMLGEPESIKRMRGPIQFSNDTRDVFWIGHLRCDIPSREFECHFVFEDWAESPHGVFEQDDSGRWNARLVGVDYACKFGKKD
jgi:hypothetical protein